MADVDGLALDLAAVDFEHLVLQDGRIVVQFSLEDRALGDLDEDRRDLDGAPLRRARDPELAASLPSGTAGRHQTHRKEQASHNGPARAEAHELSLKCGVHRWSVQTTDMPCRRQDRRKSVISKESSRLPHSMDNRFGDVLQRWRPH